MLWIGADATVGGACAGGEEQICECYSGSCWQIPTWEFASGHPWWVLKQEYLVSCIEIQRFLQFFCELAKFSGLFSITFILQSNFLSETSVANL